MFVHPKQLIPGCFIVRDVIGKTNYPIVSKNTIVRDIHIEILNKFLIEQVEVANQLENGSPFIPHELSNIKPKDSNLNDWNYHPITFEDYYWNAVNGYKQVYEGIQSGSPIDMNEIRHFAIPLFEQIDDLGLTIYLLHTFSSKQDYFFHHAIGMGVIAAFLAKKRGIEKEWIQIGLAGLLADSGMAKLTRGLFKKEGKLSETEYKEIKLHPTYSYRLVEKIPSLTIGAKLAILQHHERMDGTGYPLGVKRNKIHPYAYIVAISDTYHAMTSERLHQVKQSPFKVIEEMLQDHYQKIDHEVFMTFVQQLTNFSTGTKVKLSNGQTAEIVFVYQHYPTRPMVRLTEDNTIVSLKDHRNLYIDEIVK
ncbi:HD-GYP domain-containing protein [Aquibacillus salsiterrae]|uniref:HD-GYP domain-containing protein n=1 Tax=Aquibacillus salsiterrae TaxID=2950439 RepID=A0A9X3WFJ5_9BACI|nr:HD-GYP domain-containing protein [Aquibacillus salsiterrae]MDC3417738.1 HD-GYP domain-containing protein [Aquibacillus salsiterrae]